MQLLSILTGEKLLAESNIIKKSLYPYYSEALEPRKSGLLSRLLSQLRADSESTQEPTLESAQESTQQRVQRSQAIYQ